ncbi:MAG TPA: nucleoside triphosphate pyrophosphohydrolase family protein [bacterium]|nr:nucleoside triphosphate pyrophosphohydrolase family protein [bacterium]
MNFREYQKKSRETAVYQNLGKNYIYPLLGLAGETGEVVEKFKKLLRNNDGVIDKEFIESIKKELGDVLWYISQISTELDIELDDIAETNIKKLKSRMERNVIKSYGDDR